VLQHSILNCATVATYSFKSVIWSGEAEGEHHLQAVLCCLGVADYIYPASTPCDGRLQHIHHAMTLGPTSHKRLM
jgi:hypothetical protein